ncbi:MAG: hypothetical protein HRT93_10820 [Piscirickettsiaceae bacterium]|nr:hypothetical protein [Piscirickettsiaceae bacterium]
MFNNLEKYEVETKRKGRRIIGDLLTFEDGTKVYITALRLAEIDRDGEKTISEAMRKGTASWWIEIGQLSTLEMDDVKMVGVRVKGTNDLYLTRMSDFQDYSKTRTVRRGYKDVKCLPLKFFRKRNAEIII